MVLNFSQLLIIVLSIFVNNKFSTLKMFPLGLIPPKSVVHQRKLIKQIIYSEILLNVLL